jgi:hypothetical protein
VQPSLNNAAGVILIEISRQAGRRDCTRRNHV